MTINLDGVFVPDSELDDIVVSEIASVEVLRTIAYLGIYGSQAGPGVRFCLSQQSVALIWIRPT